VLASEDAHRGRLVALVSSSVTVRAKNINGWAASLVSRRFWPLRLRGHLYSLLIPQAVVDYSTYKMVKDSSKKVVLRFHSEKIYYKGYCIYY